MPAPDAGIRRLHTRPGGPAVEFEATARVETPVEVEYLRHGGILHMVLRSMASG